VERSNEVSTRDCRRLNRHPECGIASIPDLALDEIVQSGRINDGTFLAPGSSKVLAFGRLPVSLGVVMMRLLTSLMSFAIAAFLIAGMGSLAPAQVPKTDPKTGKAIIDPKTGKPVMVDPKTGKVVTLDPNKVKTPPVDPKKGKTSTPMPKPPTEPEAELPPIEEPTGLPSPLRLVQGLRDRGLADLGLQFLDGLKDDKNLSEIDRRSILLEKAKCKLALANDATEDAVKAGFLADARGLLDGFVKAKDQGKHPRLAEAHMALAKLTSLEAKSQLQKAMRSRDDAEQKTGKAAAKTLFTKASSEYASAAKELIETLKAIPDSVVKRTLQKDKVQAELDSAINLYNLYNTFPPDDVATVNDRKARSDTLIQARNAFDALTTGATNNPTVWIAKAWMAEIDTLQDKPEAKAANDEINRASGPSEAGRRQMKYFEVRRAYGSAKDTKSLADLQTLGRAWLTKFESPRKPTDEGAHVKYMVALSLEGEVRTSMGGRIPKGPNAPKMVDANATERTKLREAERLYREVAQGENDYMERATDHRMTVVRLMIGETIRPAKEYAKFEDAHMAAIVQASKLHEKQGGADEKAIKDARTTLISLLERARFLGSPADSHTDVMNDQINLGAMYLMSDRPYEAAVLGESLARMPRPVASRAAAAGELALAAYLAASAKAPPGPDGDETRKADRDRALRIALFVEQSFPTEVATDAVRYRLGFLSYSGGKLLEAFNYLSRIRPGFTLISEARLMEGVIAHQLLTPADSPVTPEEKVKLLNKALGDLEGVPTPEAEVASEKLLEYSRLRIRLCLLYLLKHRLESQVSTAKAPEGEPPPNPDFVKSEGIATELLKSLDSYKQLKPEHKLEARLLAQDLLTRSIYLQAVDLMKQKKTDELLAKIAPILDDVDKRGAASGEKFNDQPLEGNLQKFAAGFDADRRDVVLLALKAFISKADVGKAKEQLTRLERLGGSIDTNLSTLSQLVNEVNAQIQKLKDSQPEEAKALSNGLTQLITEITAPMDIKPAVRVFAGQALIAVDRFKEAAEVLSAVPAASPAELMVPSAEVPEARKEAVRFYKAASLYRLRALRQAQKTAEPKDFSEADRLVAEVVGTNDKKGWGFNNTEYKKEAFLLAEAKAAATPGPAASKLWGEAVQGWSQLAQLQRSRLNLSQNKLQEAEKASKAAPENPAVQANLNQARADVERAKASYFEFFFETSRSSIEAYQSVYKTNAEKMKAKYDSEAQKMMNLESQNPDLSADVRAKYVEMLNRESMKELKAAYQTVGGKMFLHKPDATTGGM